MKNPINACYFILIVIICSCNGEETNAENEWYTLENLQHLSEEITFDIDTNAVVKINPFQNRDSIEIGISNIGTVSDSREFATLLREYLVARIFLLNNKPIPNGLKVELHFKRNLKYTYYGNNLCLNVEDLIDLSFLNYCRYLLLNIGPIQSVYYKRTTPITTEFFVHNNYYESLLCLLLNFYLHEDNERYKANFFVFYDNCDFPYENLVFEKSILDSILIMTDYNPSEWTNEKVNTLYMDTFGIDTIKTINNEVYYYR